MGWTTFYKGRQTTKQWFEKQLTHELRDWMNAPEGTPFDQCPLVGHAVCLKTAVFLRHGYAAVRSTYLPDTGHPKAGTSVVWCAVYLFEHYNSKSTYYRSYGHDFGYKDMDESMGPRVTDCPAAILDLLSPLPPAPTPASYVDHHLLWQVQGALWGEDDCPEEPQEDATVACPPDPYKYARGWRAACYSNLAERAAKPKVSKGCLVRFDKPLRFSGYEMQTLRWTGKGNLFGHPQAHDLWPQYRVSKWREKAYTVVPEATKKAA